jgi:hypothetical protein
MIKKIKFFKIIVNLLAFLTGFVVVVFTIIPDTSTLLEFVAKFPFISLIGIALICIWAILMLTVPLVLLMSESKREQAFLIASNTKVRDEFEEKATSDAIKRTFIFNLALLSFIFALSGFTFERALKSDTGMNINFSYSFWDDTEQEDKDTAKTIHELPQETKDRLKEYGLTMNVSDGATTKGIKLIPQSWFSPFGILCFILLQFIMFKLFLFLNLRALNAED